jgi:hypothetical protein
MRQTLLLHSVYHQMILLVKGRVLPLNGSTFCILANKVVHFTCYNQICIIVFIDDAAETIPTPVHQTFKTASCTGQATPK